MPKPPIPSTLIETLLDIIEEESNPRNQLLDAISRMRESLFNFMAVDYDLLEKHMDQHLACNHKDCTNCNVATAEIRKQVALMRKIAMPHKAEVLEMFKRSKNVFETLTKLNTATQQNRDNN